MNYTVFQTNVLRVFDGAAMLDDGTERPDVSAAMAEIFLRWEPRDKLRAERCAYEWLHVFDFLAEPLRIASGQHAFNPHAAMTPAGIEQQVIAFIRERLERDWFPQQSKIERRAA